MRTTLLLAFMIFATMLKAQNFFPGGFATNHYRVGFAHNLYSNDSSAQKKWFITRYSAFSTSNSFFKAGHATVVSAPLGLQLNRRLNNNVYAFANATLAPAYVNFNRSFVAVDFNKGVQNNRFFKSGRLGLYSSATLGLLYINDEKTFSVSGSISVERNSYPLVPYYRAGEQRAGYTNAINR